MPHAALAEQEQGKEYCVHSQILPDKDTLKRYLIATKAEEDKAIKDKTKCFIFVEL